MRNSLVIGDITNTARGLNRGSRVSDGVSVGFDFDFNSGNPEIVFDTGDSLLYTRASNLLAFRLSSTDEVLFDGSGVRILNGLQVGFTGGTPTTGEIHIQDANWRLTKNGSSPQLIFDTVTNIDEMRYNRVTNRLQLSIDGARVFQAQGTTGSDVAGIISPTASFRGVSLVPSTPESVVTRTATNTVMGLCQVSSIGTLSGAPWNILSITKGGAGIYTVNLRVGTDIANSSVCVTPQTTGHFGAANFGSATQVAIAMTDDAGVATDVAFNFILVGRPSVDPSAL